MKVKRPRGEAQALTAWMDWLLYTLEGRRELERRGRELDAERRRERELESSQFGPDRLFIGFPWGAE